MPDDGPAPWPKIINAGEGGSISIALSDITRVVAPAECGGTETGQEYRCQGVTCRIVARAKKA